MRFSRDNENNFDRFVTQCCYEGESSSFVVSPVLVTISYGDVPRNAIATCNIL